LFSGELMSGSAGMGFTPHIINIASGEVCGIFFFFMNLNQSKTLCFGGVS